MSARGSRESDPGFRGLPRGFRRCGCSFPGEPAQAQELSIPLDDTAPRELVRQRILGRLEIADQARGGRSKFVSLVL